MLNLSFVTQVDDSDLKLFAQTVEPSCITTVFAVGDADQDMEEIFGGDTVKPQITKSYPYANLESLAIPDANQAEVILDESNCRRFYHKYASNHLGLFLSSI